MKNPLNTKSQQKDRKNERLLEPKHDKYVRKYLVVTSLRNIHERQVYLI